VSDYRRWRQRGGTYFFTLVTEGRTPILTEAAAVARLRFCRRGERRKRPFELLAAVAMPDHLHCLLRLPDGDDDFSTRLKQFKSASTRRHLHSGGAEAVVSASKIERGERGVCQRRFWEHLCLDDDEIKAYLDYIHWNPVKHGYVTRLRDWKFSSFRRWVRLGEYELDWGAGYEPRIQIEDGFD
jgi:putative transposase